MLYQALLVPALCSQDLAVLEQTEPLSIEPTNAALHKLEFVATVCSHPHGPPPEVKSWVVFFCRSAAATLGIDFAVGRLSRLAALEAARYNMPVAAHCTVLLSGNQHA
jgi:hypothetical protein